MPYATLALGIAAISMAPLLIRLTEPTSPLTTACARLLLAGVILALLSRAKEREKVAALSPRERGYLLMAGALLGLHFAVWFWGLGMTSTAAGVSLVATQPIFAGVLGALWLGEGFSKREGLGTLIACAGCIVLAGFDLGEGSRAIWGDLLSLLAAMAAASYLLVGRRLGNRLPLFSYLARVNLAAGLFLLPLALIVGGPLPLVNGRAFWAIVAMALIPSVIGHTAVNYCVRKVPVHLVSLAILVEPVAGVLSTFLVLGERPPPTALLGATAIIAGIYLGFRRR